MCTFLNEHMLLSLPLFRYLCHVHVALRWSKLKVYRRSVPIALHVLSYAIDSLCTYSSQSFTSVLNALLRLCFILLITTCYFGHTAVVMYSLSSSMSIALLTIIIAHFAGVRSG